MFPGSLHVESQVFVAGWWDTDGMRALSDAISTVPCLPGLLLLLPIGRPCLVRAKLIHNVAVRRPLLCADRKARNRCPIIGSPPPSEKSLPADPGRDEFLPVNCRLRETYLGSDFIMRRLFMGPAIRGRQGRHIKPAIISIAGRIFHGRDILMWHRQSIIHLGSV